MVFAEKDDAALMFVEPKMSAEFVRDEVIRHKAVGLKVYMNWATVKDQAKAPIRGFLAPKHIKVMDELGLMVMLHLSKPRAISDPANIRDIESLSRLMFGSDNVFAGAVRGRYVETGLFWGIERRSIIFLGKSWPYALY